MARIVSLGSALQDIYLADHDDLVPSNIDGKLILGKISVGSKVDIDKIHYSVGGGGVNSAVTFARHGHEAIVMGNIGRDSAGTAVIHTLNCEGIDASYVNCLERSATGTSVILLDTKNGERTILTHRGASGQFGNFSEKDLDLIHPDWLYITTLHGDMDTLARFLEKAQALKAKVMFNPGMGELKNSKELLKLLKYVNVLIVNKFEAAQIVPGSVLTELLYRLSGYTETTIITDGAMGGIAGNGSEIYRFGIYEDKKVQDATGAGDAFGSGFLAHFASGKSFRSSLIFAAANSTAVVSKLGANQGALAGDVRLHPMPIQKL